MAGEVPTWVQAFLSSSVVLGVLGWFTRREAARIDKKLEKIDELDKSKADKTMVDEIKQILVSAEAKADEKRGKVYERIDSLNDKLDITITNWNKTETRVAVLEASNSKPRKR